VVGEAGDGITERLARQRLVLVSSRGVSSYRRWLARSPARGFISKSELSGNALAALIS